MSKNRTSAGDFLKDFLQLGNLIKQVFGIGAPTEDTPSVFESHKAVFFPDMIPNLFLDPGGRHPVRILPFKVVHNGGMVKLFAGNMRLGQAICRRDSNKDLMNQAIIYVSDAGKSHAIVIVDRRKQDWVAHDKAFRCTLCRSRTNRHRDGQSQHTLNSIVFTIIYNWRIVMGDQLIGILLHGKHGTWLDLAEFELSVLGSQCLN